MKMDRIDVTNEVMNLIWQGLYDCQDEDSIRRGAKSTDSFVVWRDGLAYRVTIALDPAENMTVPEIMESEEE